MLRRAGFDLDSEVLVGGERVDAIARINISGVERTLAVETKFSRLPKAKYSLASTLFRLSYLKSRHLIDSGAVIVNYAPFGRDLDLANELEVLVASDENLKRELESGKLLETLSKPVASAENNVPPGHGFRKRTIFVAIHFSDHNDDVFNYGISAVAERLNMEALRVTDVEHNHIIISQIKGMIDTSDFVIADLSDDNQNVYYEAGYAEGKLRPLILIANKGTQLRFDLQAINCIFYRNITDLAERLEKRLVELTKT